MTSGEESIIFLLSPIHNSLNQPARKLRCWQTEECTPPSRYPGESASWPNLRSSTDLPTFSLFPYRASCGRDIKQGINPIKACNCVDQANTKLESVVARTSPLSWWNLLVKYAPENETELPTHEVAAVIKNFLGSFLKFNIGMTLPPNSRNGDPRVLW